VEFKALLAKNGIHIEGGGKTKTSTAFEQFGKKFREMHAT
jgi:hypothetical protein